MGVYLPPPSDMPPHVLAVSGTRLLLAHMGVGAWVTASIPDTLAVTTRVMTVYGTSSHGSLRLLFPPWSHGHDCNPQEELQVKVPFSLFASPPPSHMKII